ncbi:hypothetical protein ACFQHO_31815 [Actinomadura yumaensis]|uniref:hypothetical protein n=1 Tax=Actinomadura yumaensis TaxID=111807 RepID=UPI00360D5AE1
MHVGHLEGDEAHLGAVLSGLRQQRQDEPAAVVVPLITGPDPAPEAALREIVAGSPPPRSRPSRSARTRSSPRRCTTGSPTRASPAPTGSG